MWSNGELIPKLPPDNGQNEAPCLWDCSRRVGPGSSWNATIFCYISSRMRNLIILRLCFLQVPYFIFFPTICMNIRGSWRWAARDGQLVWLQAVGSFRRVSSPPLENCRLWRSTEANESNTSRGCECFRCFPAKQVRSGKKEAAKIKLGTINSGIKHCDFSRRTRTVAWSLLIYMQRITCEAFTENMIAEMLYEILKFGLMKNLLRMKEIVLNWLQTFFDFHWKLISTLLFFN